MAIRNIIKMGEPVLRKRSKPVTEFDCRLAELLDDLADTLKRAGGLGLAAVQVGVLRRVFIVEIDGKIVELVNPCIVKTSGSVADNEGCLSVSGFRGIVTRPQKVVMDYFDRFGKPHTIKLADYPARALMHEYDHLEGVLFCDKMSKKVDETKDD